MGLPKVCSEILELLEQPKDVLHLDTEVVIIGNGPAGLSLSTFLAGWQPYYNPASHHPDEQLHSRLSENFDRSLLDQDLSWYEEEFAERIPPNIRPLSHLYDWLVRPETDTHPLPQTSRCLRMEYEPEKEVPHIVLGDSAIGGSWNTYDDEMVTVSLSHWMDLPGFSISDWLGGQPLLSRYPAVVIRKYMRAYARKMHLNKHIRPFTNVTHLEKLCHAPTGEEYWEIRVEQKHKSPYLIKCKKVVLACGQNHIRTLDVEGELASERIIYDVANLKKALTNDAGEFNPCPSSARIIVVGDGISAADAVLFCINHGIPVVHIIRRNEKQLRSTMMSRLTSSVYPEYSKVFQLMLGRQTDPLYTKFTSSSVKAVRKTSVILETLKGEINEPFYYLVPCLGRRSELNMLDFKPNFGPNYTCSTDPSLFSIGSLAGDHFVRYLIGGCLQVAHILRVQYHHEQYAPTTAVPLAEDPAIQFINLGNNPKCKQSICKGLAEMPDENNMSCWLTKLFRVDSSPADLCNGFQLVNFENC